MAGPAHITLPMDRISIAAPYLPERIARREALVARYRTSLADVPGLAWQAVPPGARPNRQFRPVSVDPDAFGLTVDEMATALAADGIEVRRYFAPPLHRHPAFAGASRSSSPTAERIAARVVCLPLSSHLRLRDVDRVCHALVRLHARHGDVRRHLAQG